MDDERKQELAVLAVGVEKYVQFGVGKGEGERRTVGRLTRGRGE